MGGESGPLFNEDPNQPSGGWPETPPGSLDQKKQTASKGNERTEGWDQEMEKQKFSIDEAQKCWGSE